MHKNKSSQRVFTMLVAFITLFALLFPAGMVTPARADGSITDTINFTILHTNDFHGQLEPSGSNPGLARTAQKFVDVRAAIGEENVLLLDAGDIMQGSLLSNLFYGESTIDVYNYEGYDAATFGNHEFDWDQSILISRTEQADFPFVSSNIVLNDTGDCATAGWQSPSFTTPWITKTVGTPPNTAIVGILGVTTQETPYITLAGNTAGLCFKDPATSISHYYNDVVNAGADVMVVLSHIGYTDGGYGYGFPVYGDQTLAQRLTTAGTPVNLIIGGHSHTNLAPPVLPTPGTNTYVVQAHYSGRKVGRADISLDTVTGAVTINWSRITVNPGPTPPPDPQDSGTLARIAIWSGDPWYQSEINRVVGFTNVPIVRDYYGDSLMGKFVNDSIYNDLNTDAELANDVDMVFNNAGGLRADITFPISSTLPVTLTHGMLYNVLPFGNATVVGDMTGAQILELLNQSSTLFTGALQVAGVRYKFYRYGSTPPTLPYAWGAYDVEILDRDSQLYVPIVITQTYSIATNEFLAPAGQDGYTPFKYVTNITYWGDMLDGVERWVNLTYTHDAPYEGSLDGRITRNGTDTYNPSDPLQVVPVTILHHNDSHGNTYTYSGSGTYVGYAQLATLIKQEQAKNPDRTLLLNAGDSIQGDAMAYYFKGAFTGLGADGSALDPSLWINPIIAEYNAMDYTAMTLGNHEFNYGNYVFTGTLGQATFPILGANIIDNGQYGLAEVDVRPFITTTVPGPIGDIDIAVLGIANHRVPNYELPSNIPGLTFTNPIEEAAAQVPALEESNDAVVALTHIGFTTNPASVEIDNNVDTYLASVVNGIDAIVGGHSHTIPATGFGAYKYLPAIVGSPNNTPVVINQAYRYNNTLGEVILGFLPDGQGGYQVVARSGKYLSVPTGTVPDPPILNLITPYVTRLAQYNNTIIGQTEQPIDTTNAYIAETNAANLQADASIWELANKGILDVDVHISGAMTRPSSSSNWIMFPTATPLNPVQMKVSDMFTLMPYENSLVVMEMNGPQLKAVLERAYRNYYYYKYVPLYGGYSYYTTCMLDTNSVGQITYRDTYPALPSGNNVVSFTINGQPVDFNDASTYYNVSTVNYLAAGSCNFNNGGVSLWPLNQIVHDTQYYVRDAVIDYATAMGTISPTIEGRLAFMQASELSSSQKSVADDNGDGLAQFGEVLTYTIDINNTGGITASAILTDALPVGLTYVEGSLLLPLGFTGGVNGNVLEASGLVSPGTSLGITFAVQVDQALPYGELFSNQVELEDQYASYSIPPAVIPMDEYYHLALTPPDSTKNGDPGSVVIYTLQLKNEGNLTDVITLDATGLWEVNVPTLVYTLASGSTADVLVEVTIPPDAMAGESDITTITATSSDGETLTSSLLTTVANLVYGVTLTPETDAMSGDPGTVVEYTLQLTNEGNGIDEFTVEALADWETFLPTTEFTLDPGETADVLVQVTVPSDALAGDSDVATITASDGETSATSLLTTTANQVYAVTLDPDMDDMSGDPGTIVTYTLQLTNEGNGTDEFTVEALADWETFLPTTEFTLDPGETADVLVQVTVPSDAMAGDSDVATVTATSGGGDASASSELTTTTSSVYAVSLDPDMDDMSGDPGTIVTYTLQLTNEGNGTDEFTVEALADWETFLPTSEFTIEPGETADVLVQVTVPSGAMADDFDEATITATSSDGETSAASVLTTTANPVYGFTLGPLTDAKQAYVGETVEYLLHMVNTSNITETFTISYTGNMWDITLPVTAVELGAGDELDILVDVTIPLTAAHRAIDIVTISISSAHEETQEAVLTTTAYRYITIMPVILK